MGHGVDPSIAVSRRGPWDGSVRGCTLPPWCMEWISPWLSPLMVHGMDQSVPPASLPPVCAWCVPALLLSSPPRLGMDRSSSPTKWAEPGGVRAQPQSSPGGHQGLVGASPPIPPSKSRRALAHTPNLTKSRAMLCVKHAYGAAPRGGHASPGGDTHPQPSSVPPPAGNTHALFVFSRPPGPVRPLGT